MSDAHTDQSRAEFEKWARGESPSINLTREGNGYRYSLAETLYDAWHASRAAIEQSSSVELPEPQCEVEVRSHTTYVDHPIYEWRDNLPDGAYKLYTEQQVRALLAGVKDSLTAAPAVPQGWIGLTDEDRDRAFNSLPDMLDGFLKKWGWLHFAKAIEQICREKNSAQPPKEQT